MGDSPPMNMEQIDCYETLAFKRRWITQKKAHKIQNTAKVWNEEWLFTYY
jgi:hypothetical protein